MVTIPSQWQVFITALIDLAAKNHWPAIQGLDGWGSAASAALHFHFPAFLNQ